MSIGAELPGGAGLPGLKRTRLSSDSSSDDINFEPAAFGRRLKRSNSAFDINHTKRSKRESIKHLRSWASDEPLCKKIKFSKRARDFTDPEPVEKKRKVSLSEENDSAIKLLDLLVVWEILEPYNEHWDVIAKEIGFSEKEVDEILKGQLISTPSLRLLCILSAWYKRSPSSSGFSPVTIKSLIDAVKVSDIDDASMTDITQRLKNTGLS